MSHDSPTPEPTPAEASEMAASDEASTEMSSENVVQAEDNGEADESEPLGADETPAVPDAIPANVVAEPDSVPGPNQEDDSIELDGILVEIEPEGVAPGEAEAEDWGENDTRDPMDEDSVGAEDNQSVAPPEVTESSATVAADPVEAVHMDGTELSEPPLAETENVEVAPPEFATPTGVLPKPQKTSALDTVSNLLASIAELIQKGLKAIIPLSRAIAILVLRFVIQILQLLLDLLDGSWQSRAVMPTSTASTVGVRSTAPEAKTQPAGTSSPAPVKRQPVLLRAVKTVWNGLISLIRTILPDAWNQKLPTPLLNIVLAVLLALGLWTAPSLLLSRAVPAASKTPPGQTPALSQPDDQGLDSNDAGVQAPSSEIVISLDPIITESGDLTFERPVGLPAAQQKPIATLQKRLSELRNRYDSTPLLIQTVRVNPTRDRLTIELSDDWYTLTPRRQDQLVNDLWVRSQQANLPKLLLVDANQTPLARSPMVGTDVVVLQRQQSLLPTAAPSDPLQNP